MDRIKAFTTLIITLLVTTAFAQNEVSIGHWRTHLPYHKVIAVEPVGNLIYAATEYELFTYDKEDNSIHILNKINGLSDVGISTMGYCESQKKLFVAYTNANVDLIDREGNISNMSDIKDKNIVGNKSINHVFFDGDLAYVACGFGIVVFDLKREEVKDTYYIGNQGDMVNVTDVAIFNDRIYASTDDGVYYASQDAQNLANYAAWHFDTSLIHPHLAYTEMEVFGGKLFLNYDGGYDKDTLFFHDGNAWDYFEKANTSQKRELRTCNDKLLITNYYSVKIYDNSLNEILKIYQPGSSIEPQSAAIDSNHDYWIGDAKRGLIRTDNGSNATDVKPNGTASKNVFELQACGDQVWIATGGHATNWGKRYMKEGVARFQDGQWTIFNNQTMTELSPYSDFVCTLTDPNDPSVTYVGTWGKGLLKFKGDELVEVYNADNTDGALDYWIADPSLINISGLGFDSHHNLWVANTGANRLLAVMKPNGDWRSFSLGGNTSGNDIGVMIIDNHDMKWIVKRSGEIIVFNDGGTIDDESDDQVAYLNTSNTSGGLLGTANCLAVNKDGEVWVGTSDGPCYFADSRKIFSEENYKASVKEVRRNDGTDQWDPLFKGSSVLSMAVDGANQIWFGLESGVSLMSFANNPKEVHYFTTDNSPLFENSVTTMAIAADGEVFFGTASGVISYKGESAEPEPEVSDVIAYPNPVREDFNGYVGIKGLVANSLVRITTVDGSFVTQILSEGGQAVWDLNNINGQRVTAGVYLIFTSDKYGHDRFATKILVQ
jgi:streptogramin lyase